jgi:Flp pilus assembly pilin Flp
MTTKLTNLIRKFHSDEEGLEALQVVMIIAIAAMVMIACATLGKSAVSWMQGKWNTLQGTDISGGGAGAGGAGGGFPNLGGLAGLLGGGK